MVQHFPQSDDRTCIYFTFSGLDKLPDDTEAPGLGGTLDYKCTEQSEVVSNTSSNTYTLKCEIHSKDEDPFYELKFDVDIWPKCEEDDGSSRRKRQVIPLQYQYINVVVDVMFYSNETQKQEVW